MTDSSPPGPRPHEPPARLLVVDDNEDGRVVLEGMLACAGYEDVVLAASSEDVAEFFGMGRAADPQGIDAILLDVNMPGVDGIEVCRRIRREPALAHLPIIMVTAHSEEAILAQAFAAGANDYISKPVRPLELIARVRAALALKREHDAQRRRASELVEFTGWLEEANSALRRLTRVDALTRLANRMHFDAALAAEFRRAEREGGVVSLLMIDVDLFKHFNDTYGHVMGDECLRLVAGVLRDCARRPGDLAARYGGEEFVVLLPGTHKPGAHGLAERIRRAVREVRVPGVPPGEGPHVTVSVGAATVRPDGAILPETLVKVADAALYEAKGSGRDRVASRDLPAAEQSAPGGTPREIRITPRRTPRLALTPAKGLADQSRFVPNRQRDVRLLRAAICRGDLEAALRIGQALRTIGLAEEMSPLVTIGGAIADAARCGDASAIEVAADRLDAMVRSGSNGKVAPRK